MVSDWHKSRDLRSPPPPGTTAAQVARLVAVSEAEALTPMADLAGRWGITANTVSRRLSFLGIKPIRQGNYRFITAEQLDLADELQQHILSGKPQDTFPRPDQPEGGLVARRVEAPAQVAGQVEQLTALVAAVTAAQQPAVDPLSRARGLAEAADAGLVLTNDDMAALLGQGVSSWKDGHLAYGYQFSRHKQGTQVLWTVSRAVTAAPDKQLPAQAKRVGFLAEPPVAARATVNISAVSLPLL